MNILILGAGAIGGYFGGRLIEAGLSVTFLVRERRALQLRQNGVKLISDKGNFTAEANIVLNASDAKNIELIILSCKAYDLPEAIEAIKPVVTEKTMILPLLNGIAHLEMLDMAFGQERVLGGYCHLGVTVTEDGIVKHLNDLDQLTLGARLESQVPLACRITTQLAKAKLTVKNSPNIIVEMWEKYVFVTVLASVTCLFRGNIGAINSTTYGNRLITSLLEDCVHAVKKGNIELSSSWYSTALIALTSCNSNSTASMLRDLLQGKKTEHEHIIGNMVKYLESFRIVNPILTAAYTQLQINAGTC